MEDFKYRDCENKQYYSLYVLCEQLVILQTLKLMEKNDKGYRHLCSKCGINYKRIFKEGLYVVCSKCYEVSNSEYGFCMSCNCDAKLKNGRCFICNEIEDVKEAIRDFIEIDNSGILCAGCLCERKSIELRKIENGQEVYLCKYCHKTNNRVCFNMNFQDLQVNLKYENCVIKIYKSVILLSNQLLMLHFMKKKVRRDLGYKIYCEHCGKNSIRISNFKVNYLCSNCEIKSEDIGICKICKCEDSLFNGKCFICNDIEETNKGMLDFIDTDERSLVCRDCNIDKKSVENIKFGEKYLHLCKYCYLTRVQ